MSPISELIFKECSDVTNWKNLMLLFEHLIKNGPKYGYLIFDKNSIDILSWDKFIYFEPNSKKFIKFKTN